MNFPFNYRNGTSSNFPFSMINPSTYARLFPVFASKVGEKGVLEVGIAGIGRSIRCPGVAWSGWRGFPLHSRTYTYAYTQNTHTHTHTFKINGVRAELRVGVDEERQSLRDRLSRRAHFVPPSPSSRVRW